MRKEFLSSPLCKYGNEASAGVINLCKDTQAENSSAWLSISAPKHMLFLFYKHVSVSFQDVLVQELSLRERPISAEVPQSSTVIWGWRKATSWLPQGKFGIPSAPNGEAHRTLLIQPTSICIPGQSLESTPNLVRPWAGYLTSFVILNLWNNNNTYLVGCSEN